MRGRKKKSKTIVMCIPYSPDLAPSDFSLFGCIKQLLAEYKFPDRGALIEAVQEILRGIGQLHWIRFISLG
jgi:hypothetical protein